MTTAIGIGVTLFMLGLFITAIVQHSRWAHDAAELLRKRDDYVDNLLKKSSTGTSPPRFADIRRLLLEKLGPKSYHLVFASVEPTGIRRASRWFLAAAVLAGLATVANLLLPELSLVCLVPSFLSFTFGMIWFTDDVAYYAKLGKLIASQEE